MAKKKLNQEMHYALDLAAALARGGKHQEAVDAVLALVRGASNAIALQNIMDGATERGFDCEFYPIGGEMGVRVAYVPKGQ